MHVELLDISFEKTHCAGNRTWDRVLANSHDNDWAKTSGSNLDLLKDTIPIFICFQKFVTVATRRTNCIVSRLGCAGDRFAYK